MDHETSCYCSGLDDLAVIGMGSPDGMDERVFATLDEIQSHGGHQWWLYVSRCSACGQDWMVAQDERIHDNFYLKRVSRQAVEDIVHHSRWPSDFITYEQVLRLGRESGRVASFLDLRSPALVDTAADLRRERPDISVQEVAYVLAIPVKTAEKLLGP